MAPLCGWEYLKNTPHIVPECRFEFNAYGVTSKITITDTSNTKLIKDIATVAFKASKAQKSAYLSTAPTTI